MIITIVHKFKRYIEEFIKYNYKISQIGGGPEKKGQ